MIEPPPTVVKTFNQTWFNWLNNLYNYVRGIEKYSVNNQTGTTYTTVSSDANHVMVSISNASANTITIPANSSVAYPIGTYLNFTQAGAGATTIAIATDTLNVNANLTKVLNGQYAVASAFKLAETEWVLFGNLVAA